MPHLPLVVTEFNAGLGINVASTAYSASFSVHQFALAQAQAGISVLSFWAFSDIFEEGGFHSNPYEQSIFGMQTIYGVKKPVYRAFEMMARLHEHGVVATSDTIDAVVSVDTTSQKGRASVIAVVTNFANYGDNITAVTAQLRLSSVGNCSTASVEVLDDSNGNPMAQWQRDGAPIYPTVDEVRTALCHAAVSSPRLWS